MYSANCTITTNPNSIYTTANSVTAVDTMARVKEYLDRRIADLSKNPLYQHKCVSCGGTVELDPNRAIFICPYCGSHYALNTKRINDAG